MNCGDSGRDIALSNNQSPVVKFYNLSYPMDYEQRLKRYSGAFKPVKGIQLWQDWNLQVRDWAMKQKSENNLDRYYYSSIRSEDLVKNDPWNQWRYLADIIGFKGDLPKLCCLFGQNHAEARDYGTSARVRDVTQQQQRYRLKDYRVDFKTLESWTARWQFKISHLYPATTQKTKKDLVDVGLALSEQWQQVVGTTTSNSNSTYDEHAYSTWQSIRSKLKSLTNNFSLEGSPSHQKFSKLLDSSFWNGTAPKKIIDPNLYQKLVQTMQDQQQNKPHHHQVEQRYGKWERILANQTKLSDSLHREGARALKAFGYEPFIPWIHPSHVSNSEFVCDIKTAC